ncbi:MAG: galactose-1-phosphate uridylyltransferase, partial [Lachnospiraceae bacterium]|nr:galactose-1-phosphate uridylyltransferase [Lachnospiraceae bacterium]
LKEAILGKKDIAAMESIAAHADWAKELMAKYDDINADNITKIIEDEIGIVFAKVLEHAGVFKDTPEGNAAFDRFIATVA